MRSIASVYGILGYFASALGLTKAIIWSADWEKRETPWYWLLIETLLCWDYFFSIYILDFCFARNWLCYNRVLLSAIDFSLLTQFFKSVLKMIFLAIYSAKYTIIWINTHRWPFCLCLSCTHNASPKLCAPLCTPPIIQVSRGPENKCD